MSNPVKQTLYPEAHLGSNAFPMDNRHIMSGKLGMKIPCYVRHTVPKGVYNIDCAAVSRTSELQTANFSRISSNIDFYFVPYSMMFHRFNDVYNTRSDKQRRELLPFNNNVPNVSMLPNFSLPALLNTLFFYWLYTESDNVAKPTSEAGYSLTTYRDFAVQDNTRNVADVDPVVDVRVYVKLPDDGVYRDMLRDVFGHYSIEDRLRLLDMLGYGNWLPVFKSFMSLWLEAFISPKCSLQSDDLRVYIDLNANSSTVFWTDANQTTHSESESFVPAQLSPILDVDTPAFEAIKTSLSEQESLREVVLGCEGAFGFEGYLIWSGLVDRKKTAEYWNTLSSGNVVYDRLFEEYGKRCSVFALAAYQKVWSDFSRNQFYDIEQDYSQFFNYDWFDDTKVLEHELNSIQVMCLLTTPRYAAWRKDVFTGSLPNAQFGDVAVAMLNGNASVDGSVFGSNPALNGSDLDLISQTVDGRIIGSTNQDTRFVVHTQANTSSVGVSVASIRYANALQRYRETLMRAGNRTKDLWRAQFGVTSKFIDDNYSIYLGSFDGDYQINPIQATSTNDDTTLGQLGASGLAVIKGKEMQVNTSDFGVIIGVLTIVPRSEYDNFGIWEHNVKLESDDYWKPDFENLGLAGVFKHQFNVMSELTGEEIDGQSDVVFGYSARYHEYKTALDYVHGEFFGSNPLHECKVPVHDGAFSDFVTPRPVDDFRMPLLENIYINPITCDSIFYEATNQFQSSDHFKFAIGFSETDVLGMSVTGLPYGK